MISDCHFAWQRVEPALTYLCKYILHVPFVEVSKETPRLIEVTTTQCVYKAVL